jgi:hypothetical protein
MLDHLLPFLLAATVGFTHAFEVDHLVAVSSIVTRRQSVREALLDGVFWGLGHTSTILLIGVLMILVRIAIPESTFGHLEAGVGLMLIVLGLRRLLRASGHAHPTAHSGPQHRLAYGVGLVHGLAGSGALILLAMTQLHKQWESLAYLLIFGIGSVGGMLVASGVLSLPFSRNMRVSHRVQGALTTLSALLCLGLGLKIVLENLL